MYGHFNKEDTFSGSSSQQNEAPDDQAAVAILQHLDKMELHNLLESDDKLQELIHDLPQVKNIQTEREMLMTQNKSAADYNTSLQPKLDHLKTRVATGYEEANRLKTTLAMDKSRLDIKLGEQSLDTVGVLLKTATAKTEEEAEEISDQFFDRKMDVDIFLEQYLSKRTLSHQRLVKSQKLSELVRAEPSLAPQSSQQQSYNWGSPGTSYPASPPVAPPGGALPYPSGPSFQMPEAGYYNHR